MENERIKKIVFIIGGTALFILILFFSFYLINSNYINNVEFVLNGSPIVEIEQGSTWTDPSVSARYKGKLIDFEVEGNVNTAIPGQYKIVYTVKKGMSKKTLSRLVVVRTVNDNFTLTLKGNTTMYISKGSNFVEPGFTAYYNDVDVSKEVVVTGFVNKEVAGEYTINYSVQKDGYVRQKTRKVIVITFNYQLNLSKNDGYVAENTIIFSTNDANYSYILLPDGKTSYSNNVSYKVEKNDIYSFTIYNKLGFIINKSIEVKNIDKSVPKGSCFGYMYDNYTNLVVNAKDDSGIAGYEYLYGNKKSEKINTSEYKYYENVNKATVNIYDKANNKITITCNMVDKSTSVASSYKSYTFTDPTTSRKMNYWLYIPENLSKRNSVPLMIYLHGDGSRGDNIKLVNKYSYPKFVNEGTKYPFMMIAAQINYETNWTNEGTYQRLMRLVDEIISRYNVNTKKIILAGGSSGGGGAYKITSAYPNYFSCTVIGSGMYDSAYRNFANKLTNTPMWIFHGTKDSNISYSSVKSFAEYINSLGGKVKFVGVEGGTHGVTETDSGFKNKDLIDWMLAQER